MEFNNDYCQLVINDITRVSELKGTIAVRNYSNYNCRILQTSFWNTQSKYIYMYTKEVINVMKLGNHLHIETFASKFFRDRHIKHIYFSKCI